MSCKTVKLTHVRTPYFGVAIRTNVVILVHRTKKTMTVNYYLVYDQFTKECLGTSTTVGEAG